MAEPTTTVYSYYLPEVRPIIDRIAYNFPHEIYRQNFKPGLDDLHLPLMDAYTDFANLHGVRGFSYFHHQYYANGSSEALFHLLARHSGMRLGHPLCQLAGEYQGYSKYVDALGYNIENVAARKAAEYHGHTFIISQPSAIHGNILSQAFLDEILEHNQVILDLAYLGMTEPFDLDLSHPNIIAVVGSMSKPFGLYYHRIGFCWAREPVNSLYGNKWFKNVFSIKVAEEVLKTLDLFEVRKLYREWQKDACIAAQEHVQIPVEPSDVWLLGYSRVQGSGRFTDPPAWESFRRGPGCRFCLTPYYIERERMLERVAPMPHHNAVARAVEERDDGPRRG